MRPNPLDDPSVNRLLAGAVRPEDAPPGYAGVADLLAEARPQPASAELPRQAAMVAAMQTAISSQPAPLTTSPRRTVLKKILTAKVAAATAAIMLTASGAAAATGSLPGAAQDVASNALAKVGISVPGHDDHAGDHPDSRGKSGDHAKSGSDDSTHTTSATPGSSDENGPDDHAQFGQCNAQAKSDGHPNEHSAVAQPKDCTDVTHPGNPGGNSSSGTHDSGDDNEHTPASTPAGPPASTPGDDHSHVSTPNQGSASDGHGNSGSSGSSSSGNGSSSGSSSSSGSGGHGEAGEHGQP